MTDQINQATKIGAIVFVFWRLWPSDFLVALLNELKLRTVDRITTIETQKNLLTVYGLRLLAGGFHPLKWR